MNKNCELRAQFLLERHRWDETVLIQCRDEKENLLTIKAKAEPDELVPGLTYNFFGSWTTHYQYGRQFVAQTFVKVLPHDERGIIAYLVNAPGIGNATARLLWDKYTGDAVKILREQPERVSTELHMKRFTVEKAKEAAAFLAQEQELEDATIRLMNLLAGKGFPRTTLKAAIKKWGNRAADVVKKNAYQLMPFRGCGFGRCDDLYLEQGGNPAKLKRQALCIWHAISRDGSGSSWFDTSFIEKALNEKIGSAKVLPVKACKLGLRSNLLAAYRNGGARPWITEGSRSRAEQDVADRVAFFVEQKNAWPGVDGLDISEHQGEELAKALQSPIGILGGSPGTGKTHISARLIARLIAIHGQENVAVVAPTGKAAVRITEFLDAKGISLRARTIHSFLGVVSVDEGGSGFAFEHCQGNPVTQRFIVVDEVSMADCSLFASLLGALRPEGHLLLVGDLQQLPPVAHGAPLRDLLTSGIPAGDLREIRRNSGLIVETCAAIRDERHFELPRKLNLSQGVNLALCEKQTGEESVEQIMRLVKVIREKGEYNPTWDVQVIVAVNEKSPLSRKELNKLLQTELNGNNRGKGKFWPHDKVVCLKNCFLPAVDAAMEEVEEDEEGFFRTKDSGKVELYVANGELGRVVEEYPNRLILEFLAPKRVVLVPRSEEQKDEIKFDLGYAISCHKSQGSSWPIVIIALDEYMGARMICDRSWIYTGLSRAEKACILVGQEETLRRACRQQKISQRKTFLVERLKAAMLENENEEKRRSREILSVCE